MIYQILTAIGAIGLTAIGIYLFVELLEQYIASDEMEE